MPQEPKRLHRSRTKRLIAGVCGGIGEYFNLDPTLVRLVFLLLVFLWGAGIIFYLILAIIIPLEGQEEVQPELGKRVKETAAELKSTAQKFASDIKAARTKSNGNASKSKPKKA